MMKRTLLTLEERLALAAKSRASSPESAVRLVQRLSNVNTVNLFCKKANLDLMAELMGEFLDRMGDELFHYSGFCRCFRMAVDCDSTHNLKSSAKVSPTEIPDPYQPILGVRVNNAVILLGLILLDHAKARMKCKDIYYCTRMTLGQYLDALTDLSLERTVTSDQDWAESYRIWQNTFRKRYDGEQPLREALADILRDYITAWQGLDALEYVLRREEGHDGPFPLDVPDPGNEDTAPGALYSRIFLPERDYHPETLRELAARSSSSDLKSFLEKSISEGKLFFVMREINLAVMDLYMLWVHPYLRQ